MSKGFLLNVSRNTKYMLELIETSPSNQIASTSCVRFHTFVVFCTTCGALVPYEWAHKVGRITEGVSWFYCCRCAPPYSQIWDAGEKRYFRQLESERVEVDEKGNPIGKCPVCNRDMETKKEG